jgi:hypothetical protein
MLLRIGPDLPLNLERPVEVALATISAPIVCVCWRGASVDSPGKCATLNLDDSSKGHDLVVTSGKLKAQHWYASVTALSSKVVVVCYQDIVDDEPFARCNSLRVIGMSLERGPNLDLSDGSTGAEDISVARLSDILAVVCYRGGLIKHYTTCNSLNLYGNSLEKGPDVVVHTEGAKMTSTSALSDTLALVCYRASEKVAEGVSPGRGVCNLLVASVTPATPPPTIDVTSTMPLKGIMGVTTGGAQRRPSPCIWVWILAVWIHIALRWTDSSSCRVELPGAE